jgi:alpha-tubulin suppressor-like RCC1 family protein
MTFYEEFEEIRELHGKVHLIAAKTNDAFFATEDKLYVIGRNEFQNAGIAGHAVNKLSSVPSFEGKCVVDMSCGYGHCTFLTSDNKVWVTGNNGYGQLGNGDKQFSGNTNIAMNPIIDPSLVIESVHCGYAHNVIITDDGRPYGFGNNRESQITEHESDDVYFPTLMASCMRNGRIIDCSCGQYSVAFLTDQGSVIMRGRLGQNKFFEPTVVKFDAPAIAFAIGEHDLFSITNDGKVYQMIDTNHHKKLGNLQLLMRKRPVIAASVDYGIIYFLPDTINSISRAFPFIFSQEKNQIFSDCQIMVYYH